MTGMYTIPAGQSVCVARVADPRRTWLGHIMRKTLTLPEYRSPEVFGSSGAIIFRSGDWFLMTRRDRVGRIT